jgi:FtsP/CotA-like multicopper oxidase with cupredoxin domain
VNIHEPTAHPNTGGARSSRPSGASTLRVGPDQTATPGPTQTPILNRWLLNGKTFPDTDPLVVREGERVRLRFQSMAMMFHPMHLHGHTFGLLGSGVRKDTVIVRPMETIEVDLDANNPGRWLPTATTCTTPRPA